MAGKVYEIMTKATLSKGTKKRFLNMIMLLMRLIKILRMLFVISNIKESLGTSTIYRKEVLFAYLYSHLNESYLLKQQITCQDAIDLNMKRSSTQSK